MEPQGAQPPHAADWVEALPLARLHAGGPTATRIRGRQVALFVHDGAVLACNNRCPHEGYPLCEGTLDAGGLLTCQWHNWKFDLRSGANLYGGDALRTYPTRVLDGAVWVDVAEPPPEQRVAQVQAQLDEACADHDPPRIARELARLERAGLRAETAVAQAFVHALEASHTRLRYGMTHAYAAADAWLRLRESLADPSQRLACATEALAYIGFDTLREPPFPYATAARPWDAPAFLDAVQAQDEAAAAARLNGGFAAGIELAALEPALAAAALAHYSDFGHSLIYLTHIRSLVMRLGPTALPPLLLAWTRSLVHATREDLLPDFKAYAAALADWPAEAGSAGLADLSRVAVGATAIAPALISGATFEALSIRNALAATLDAAQQHAPPALWPALMEAGAHHLLRFDERLALRTDNAVTDDVGWLDFSHALTFGHAVRLVCTRLPALWPQGLLQMALFVGRNTPYLTAGLDSAAAQAPWQVDDVAAFDAEAQTQIIDHGLGLPIFPAHWLKTWLAVHDSVALGVPAATAQAMHAAVRRLLAVRFKQRHSLRAATQALKFVERE